eukprot:TRINITY_DN11064_c0_g1_i1.p1 TRINITY_DN11064_c0_g1~~TRINITY_DN11064_c0_g1_i1.p1  ORF type:complete len:206 (-),score=22.61 TRINITY_DN11064_c0_g1_i1:214-831(-)
MYESMNLNIFFHQQKTLARLVFSRNPLRPNCVKYFQNLPILTNMKYLDLGLCVPSNEVTEACEIMPNLTVLCTEGRSMKPLQMSRECLIEITKLKYLEELSLGWYTVYGLDELDVCMQNMKKFKTRYCRFPHHSIQALPTLMPNVQELQVSNITKNILVSLLDLKDLHTLDMSGCFSLWRMKECDLGGRVFHGIKILQRQSLRVR